MKNQNKPNIKITSEIHSDFGAYHFDEDNVTVVSEPEYKKLVDTVSDLPDDGRTVITPELAMLDDHELKDAKNFLKSPLGFLQLHNRLGQLLEASQGSSNTLLVGAPIASEKRGYNNGLYIVRDGEVIQKQRKTKPGVFELLSETYTYDDDANRYFDVMGAVALVCSEMPMAYDLPDRERQAETFYVSAAWGMPPQNPEKAKRDYGSIDAYNAATLEAGVRLAASEAPNLKKIYIADRPMSGAPLNGKIEIERHQ